MSILYTLFFLGIPIVLFISLSCISIWILIITFIGIPIKSTLDNSTSVQYAGLIQQLADKARSVVRDLDPSNDLMFLRMRTKKHEIMVAPGKCLYI